MATSNPLCSAEDCDRYVGESGSQIHGIELDGVTFTVYACEECLERMDRE